VYVVGAKEAGSVEALFVPHLVADSGDACLVVRVQNVNDPQNALYFTMRAHIIAGTALRFQKSGGRQMSDVAACVGNSKSGEGAGELVAPFAVVMPEMVLPVAADVKCSEMFQVTNAWKEPLELKTSVHTEPLLKHLVTLDIVSCSASQHCGGFTLTAGQPMQIAVNMKCNQELFLVPEELRGKQVVVGRVKFLSQSKIFPPEEVTVLATFAQGQTLTVSVERINLTFPNDISLVLPISRNSLGQHAQTSTFTLRSKCAAPVPFEIEARLPAGLDDSRVDILPSSGVLAAMSSLQVRLTVDVPLDQDGRFVTCQGPSSMVLEVRDTRVSRFQLASPDASGAGPRPVHVNLFQEVTSDAATPKSRLQSTSDLPALSLRGCRVMSRPGVLDSRAGGDAEEDREEDDLDGVMHPLSSTSTHGPAQSGSLFEMNANKVNQHAQDGAMTWNLELEYVGKGGPQSFHIYTGKDDSWIRIKEGDDKGQLNAKGDTKTVEVSLVTDNIGVFSAYIYIDNLANPFDRKYIRVTIEVVMEHVSALQAPGDKNTASSFFSYLCPLLPRFLCRIAALLPAHSYKEQSTYAYICR